MRLRILHKGLIYLCLPLLIQGAFFLELFNLIAQTEKSMERQNTHISIAREMDFIIIQFCRTLAVCGKDGTRDFMPVREYKSLMDAHLHRLERDIKSTSEDYQQVFNSSKKLVFAQYALLELMQSDQDDSQMGSLSRLSATKQVISNAENAGPIIYKAWMNEERLLEEERLREKRSRERIKQLVLWASVFDFILAVAFIAIFIKNITQRLRLLVKNAEVLPSSSELPYKVDGSDEIAFLDQAMHSASTELVNAAAYRRSLLGMIAHDLRNPLMAVNGAFEVMLRADKLEVSEEKLRSLQLTTGQMTNLLNDLLTLDRVESNELKLDLELIQAPTIVSDAFELAKAQLDERSIELKRQVEAISVIGDRNRLIQVLSNFIGNAARYAPAQSTVSVVVAREGQQAVFSVIDQGPGIAPELHVKLFDKYFQAKEAKKNSAQTGYGLGLAICKQIIERHGGTIGVKSKPGSGATFWFSLSLDEEDVD